MRLLSIIVLMLLAPLAQASPETTVETINGPHCKPGVHSQPNGIFAVYVFCDDALGTNIAVFLSDLGAPLRQKWTLTQRFWQGEPWAADVAYIGWVPKKNLLVVSSSPIYGEGAVYVLDLETQTHTLLLKAPEDNECGATIVRTTETAVTLGLKRCSEAAPYKLVEIQFPQSNQPVKSTPKGAGARSR